MKSRTVIVMLDIADRDSAIALSQQAQIMTDENDKLHLVYVMPYGYFSYIEPYVSEESIEQAADRARDELTSIKESALHDSDAILHVLRGGIGEQALLLIDKLQCDFLMLNAHRPNVKVHSLGSYAAQIVRHAPCSVFVRR